MPQKWKAAIAAASSLAVFAIGTGSAHADWIRDGNGWSAIDIYTSLGDCYATVNLTGTNQDYAYGHLENIHSGYTCSFWLERGHLVPGTTNTVNDYSYIGSFGTNPDLVRNPGPGQDLTSMNTGSYWDGPCLRVRLCFQFMQYSTGNRVHCTDGV